MEMNKEELEKLFDEWCEIEQERRDLKAWQYEYKNFKKGMKYVKKLIFGDPVAGWASTICIIVFIGGVQLFCMGIMGRYLAKMYMEVKQRPIYIISESNYDNVGELEE